MQKGKSKQPTNRQGRAKTLAPLLRPPLSSAHNVLKPQASALTSTTLPLSLALPQQQQHQATTECNHTTTCTIRTQHPN